VHADVAIQSQKHVVQGQGRHHQGQLQGQVVAATTSNPGAWFSIPFNQQQHQPTLPAQTVASSDCSAGLDRLFPTTFQQDLTKQNNCFVDGSLGQAAGSVMVQSVIRRQYTDTFSVMAAATFTAPVSANSTDSYSAASYCPKTFNRWVLQVVHPFCFQNLSVTCSTSIFTCTVNILIQIFFLFCDYSLCN